LRLHTPALAFSAFLLAGLACSLVERPAADTTAPPPTATAVPDIPTEPPTPAPSTPSIRAPQLGHYEGTGPEASFDLTEAGVESFFLVVPFGAYGQGNTCTIGPLDATLELMGVSFTIEQTVGEGPDAFQALLIEGTIFPSSPVSTATGTYSITLCGDTITAPPSHGFWSAEWQGAAAAPTEAPPGASLPAVYIRPFCECTETAEFGQAVYLRWGWVATTEELTRAYIDASSQKVWIDGLPDPVLWSIGNSDWGEITWNADYQGYASTWSWPLPPLSRGSHLIEIEVTLSEAVSDGYDTDGDGQADVYGPGVVDTGWAELVVH
jgi:hypothetical protein